MTNLRRVIFALLLLAALGFAGISFYMVSRSDEASGGTAMNAYTVEPVSIPERLRFAGEKVPMEIHYVRENLERELTINTYWHSSTILMLKRAGRWFPVFEPILKKHGIPDDFKYLALIESGLMQEAVSPSGASGFWQFLEGTAKDYGLEVTKDVDERYHPLKATEATCRYLKDAYEKYGNWTLVAASYNAGQKRISKLIEDQRAETYYDLYLNTETARYVYRILAIKEIFQDPGKYGFLIGPADLYPPLDYRTFNVTGNIKDLAQFAQDHDISYATLKEYNPWLRNTSLKVKRGKSYDIWFPEKSKPN